MKLTKGSILALAIFAGMNLTSLAAMAQGREEPRPRQVERPRTPTRLEPGHPHFDFRGRYVPHPGYHPGAYDRRWHPDWVVAGLTFMTTGLLPDVPPGYWQCTAFQNPYDPISDYAPTEDQAEYAAVYSCAGSPDYQSAECYIPPNGCIQR